MEFSSKQIADLVGVTVRALRHYEAIGLLAKPSRTGGNYRVYTPANVLDLLRIKRLTNLGFQLSEVAEIMRDPGGSESTGLLRRLDQQLAQRQIEIEAQRLTIAEILRTGAPIDVLPEFAARLLVMRDVDPTDDEEMTKIIIDVVTGLGDSEDVNRLRAMMDQALAPSPETQRMIELDSRLRAIDAQTPPEEIDQLVQDYATACQALLQTSDISPGQGWSSRAPIKDVLQSLVHEHMTDLQGQVFERISTTLKERLQV
ncbi:MAG: MerR family transcriptional regulator [Propionibacteriaceae bacterium]|jgi:DNA-binding transcriptional MerR regulator|nr:MerR family transcriptional regulator [Propionibacteriaceae bacterium]